MRARSTGYWRCWVRKRKGSQRMSRLAARLTLFAPIPGGPLLRATLLPRCRKWGLMPGHEKTKTSSTAPSTLSTATKRCIPKTRLRMQDASSMNSPPEKPTTVDRPKQKYRLTPGQHERLAQAQRRGSPDVHGLANFHEKFAAHQRKKSRQES